MYQIYKNLYAILSSSMLRFEEVERVHTARWAPCKRVSR